MSVDALLVLQDGPDIHRITAAAIVMGRSQSCDLSFDKKGVSRRHCELVVRPDGVLLRDLGSTHGTYIDGSRMSGEAIIERGAVVRLGSRGPRVRLVDARLDGRPVPHDGGAGAAGQGGGVPRTAIMSKDAAIAARPAAANPSMDPPPSRSIFGRGFVIGLLIGAGGGAGALLLLEPGPWIQLARDALEKL